MEKVKFLLLFALLGSFSLQTNAQSPADSASFNKEFGFGTNIILNNVFNSSGAPLDFMYRWKSGNGYLRLGTSVNYNTSRDNHSNLRFEYLDQGTNLGVNIGKEWRSGFSDRWILNYGADFNLYFSRQVYEQTNKQEDNRLYFNRQVDTRFGPGIRPFVGLMFKINQRLMLGTEASFLARFQRYVETSEGYVKENGVINEDQPNHDEEIKGWEASFHTTPASNIFVYYRF